MINEPGSTVLPTYVDMSLSVVEADGEGLELAPNA